MSESIELRSRAGQIADQIEAEIRSGTWTSQLPGNRPLAQRYGVNVKTCAAALDLLEQRGWLAPAEIGRRRSILAQTPKRKTGTAKSEKRLLVLHPAVGGWALTGNTLLNKFAYTWSRRHGEVIWQTVDYSRVKRPGPLLDSFIARHSPDALLLCMPGAHWTREAWKRLPFYQLGGLHDPEVPLSFNAFKIDAELSRTVEFLCHLGHRRILVPQQSMGEKAQQSAVRGLRKGIGGEPDYGRWENYCPDFSENVPEVWMDYWERSFKALRPTAVILFEDVHLLSFYGFCYTRGIRIPEDVSVISMDDHPLFKWYKPKPTVMRYPDRAAVAHFQKWIKGGMKPIGKKYFSLEMIEGETVGPARKDF